MEKRIKNDIEEFNFRGRLPYEDRIFFIQHLMPYVFFRPMCEYKRVLEIGIGEGFGIYYLSKAVHNVVGLDIELSSGYSLKKYIEKYKMSNIHFVNANGILLPFKNGSFDRVISCQVIEHIPEDKLILFLQEIYRVLKNKGLCLIATLNLEHNIKKPSTYEKLYQHYKEFNKEELRLLLSRVFSQVEILGLDVSLKHRFFRRLKKWGFLQYHIKDFNPVSSFYNNVSPHDFRISQRVTKSSLDLIGLCTRIK